jgi:hypothetical protein
VSKQGFDHGSAFLAWSCVLAVIYLKKIHVAQTPIGNTIFQYRLGLTTLANAAWLNLKCASSTPCNQPI